MAEQVHPLIRRVLAPNPSVMTATGTQTHIVGHGRVAVIDPGPAIPVHRDAILAALAPGERVEAILVTHTHRDHSPLARDLAAATGAPVIGCVPLAGEMFDETYAPDRVLADGEATNGPGWTLRALATPGHTSNHLAFVCPEAEAIFTGDHVMGWSTTVVIPPDGDMGAYLASLDRLLALPEQLYFPAHGDSVTRGHRLVRSMAAHRRQREAQVVRLLSDAPATVPALVARMYAGLAPDLVRAAEASTLAHLIDLARQGRVAADGERWRHAR